MLEQISNRFKSIEHFRVFSVLNFDLFENHSKSSSDRGLKIQEKLDGPFFDIIRLMTGLNVMYTISSSEFRRKHF